MRLSEAIRLGSMLKPQAFGVTFRDGKTCGLGAAYDAAGLLGAEGRGLSALEYERIELAFPMLSQGMVKCPACGVFPDGDEDDIADNITHLNDEHRWTREQIADQVELWEKEFAGLAAAQAHSAPPSINAVDPNVQPQERLVRTHE